MLKFRKPTLSEEVTAWRALAWEMNLHRTITLNQAQIDLCLRRIDAYVASHSDANGTRCDPEVNQNIWSAFWLHIANDPTTGQKR